MLMKMMMVRRRLIIKIIISRYAIEYPEMIIYAYSFIATTFQSTQLLRVFETFEFEKETSILYPFCEVFSNKYL